MYEITKKLVKGLEFKLRKANRENLKKVTLGKNFQLKDQFDPKIYNRCPTGAEGQVLRKTSKENIKTTRSDAPHLN